MVLKLSQQQQRQIYRHAQRIYPEECCGILFGIDRENQTIVATVWETENVWESSDLFASVIPSQQQETGSRRDRFTIDPAVLLKAQKYARQENLNIVGIYHSHPDHVAIPSEFDRAIAWEIYSYLIMSVQQGKVVDCRSWVLDDHQQFQEETIVIV